MAEWIRFADAKAAVVLTVAGALSGRLIPTLTPFLDKHPTGSGLVIVALLLFAGWLILTVAACFCAFRCILPFRRKGQHPALDRCAHFHPAAIASRYSMDDHDRFIAGYNSAGIEGFQREVLAGLLIDSHISASKYGWVTMSVRLLGYGACLALCYVLVVQF